MLIDKLKTIIKKPKKDSLFFERLTPEAKSLFHHDSLNGKLYCVFCYGEMKLGSSFISKGVNFTSHIDEQDYYLEGVEHIIYRCSNEECDFGCTLNSTTIGERPREDELIFNLELFTKLWRVVLYFNFKKSSLAPVGDSPVIMIPELLELNYKDKSELIRRMGILVLMD